MSIILIFFFQQINLMLSFDFPKPRDLPVLCINLVGFENYVFWKKYIYVDILSDKNFLARLSQNWFVQVL